MVAAYSFAMPYKIRLIDQLAFSTQLHQLQHKIKPPDGKWRTELLRKEEWFLSSTARVMGA